MAASFAPSQTVNALSFGAAWLMKITSRGSASGSGRCEVKGATSRSVQGPPGGQDATALRARTGCREMHRSLTTRTSESGAVTNRSRARKARHWASCSGAKRSLRPTGTSSGKGPSSVPEWRDAPKHARTSSESGISQGGHPWHRPSRLLVQHLQAPQPNRHLRVRRGTSVPVSHAQRSRCVP